MRLKQRSIFLTACFVLFTLSACQHKDLDSLQQQGDHYFKTMEFRKAIEVYKMCQHDPPSANDYYKIGRAYYYDDNYPEADSAFSKLIELQPDVTLGYIWKANIRVMQDLEAEVGLARPYFEKVVEIGLKNPEKNKKDLLSAYRYLGYCNYLKKDYANAISSYEQILALNPGDQDSKEALGKLRKYH